MTTIAKSGQSLKGAGATLQCRKPAGKSTTQRSARHDGQDRNGADGHGYAKREGGERQPRHQRCSLHPREAEHGNRQRAGQHSNSGGKGADTVLRLRRRPRGLDHHHQPGKNDEAVASDREARRWAPGGKRHQAEQEPEDEKHHESRQDVQERRLEGHPNTLADGCLGPEEVSSERRFAVAGSQGMKRAKAESERKRAHASGAQFDRKARA